MSQIVERLGSFSKVKSAFPFLCEEFRAQYILAFFKGLLDLGRFITDTVSLTGDITKWLSSNARVSQIEPFVDIMTFGGHSRAGFCNFKFVLAFATLFAHLRHVAGFLELFGGYGFLIA